MIVLFMLRRALPIFIGQLLQTLDEPRTVALVSLQSLVQVNLQQRTLLHRLIRVVCKDARVLLLQYQVEPLEEDCMHFRQVTHMLMRRPLAWLRAALKILRRNFAHERQNYLWSVFERNGYCFRISHLSFNLAAITFAAVAPAPTAPLIVGASGLETSPTAKTLPTLVSCSPVTTM